MKGMWLGVLALEVGYAFSALFVQETPYVLSQSNRLVFLKAI